MAGYEAELTASLRKRGEMPDGARILAAWSGFLVELTGTGGGWDLSDRPVAIFGISARSGHVLSRLGILSFDITDLRGPHSPHQGYLRFAVLGNGGARVEVGIAVDGAVAIAGQLADATRGTSWPGSRRGGSRQRPPAKRRVDPARAWG